MRLTTPAKLLILAATITPLVYMTLFLASIAFTAANGPNQHDFVFEHFGIFMAVHMAVMLLMFALIAFYIVYLFKTDAVKTELKALWAVVLFMGGPIAMPIFWYLYIWPSAGALPPEPAG